MRICLDTSAYSAFKRGNGAAEWGLRLLTTDSHFDQLPQVSVLPLD